MSQSRGEDEGEGGASGLVARACANSGSHCTLVMLMVMGLAAMGIMVVVFENRTIGYPLCGAWGGVALLSICLCACKKLRYRATQLSAEGSTEVLEERFTVPSYEEVVGSGSYPAVIASGSGTGVHISSASQLPSYEEVLETGPGVLTVVEGMEAPPDLSQPSAAAAVPPEASGGRWDGRTARELLSLKIHGIKSERASSVSNPPPLGGGVVFSIEPLTPPPQYDDEPPTL